MRQRRIDRGALTLASAEVKFQIDTETHDPLDIGMFAEKKMLLMNRNDSFLVFVTQTIVKYNNLYPSERCTHPSL